MAARNFKPSSAVSAIVCWADILLAKLGDLSTFLATDFRGSRPDKPLPDVLLAHQQEDSTKAAVQLPGNINLSYTDFSDAGQDNWDMVPSLLSSSRASPAAKRLTVRLLYGCHILFGRTLGRGVSHDIAYVVDTKIGSLN